MWTVSKFWFETHSRSVILAGMKELVWEIKTSTGASRARAARDGTMKSRARMPKLSLVSKSNKIDKIGNEFLPLPPLLRCKPSFLKRSQWSRRNLTH